MSKPTSSSTTSSMNINQPPDHPRYQTVTGTPTPADVEALGQRLPGEAGSGSINGGMKIRNAIPVAIVPVDRRTIQGSYPGDSRSKPGDVAKASMNVIANPPGPRDPVRQFKNSRNDQGGAFQSTEVTEVGD